MDETDTDFTLEELSNRFANLLVVHSLLSPKDTETLLQKLQELVTNINWSPEGLAELFAALLKRFESSTTNDRSHLLPWMMKMLNSIEINYITPRWSCPKGKTVIELVKDETVTDENLQKCLNDDREKTLDEILKEIQQQKLNHIDEKLLEDVKEIVSAVDEDLTSLNDRSEKSQMKTILQRLCRVAGKTHFRPRLTQMVSWCLMALSETGRLIQVGTGEGKSCIVAMFAAFRAMKGQKVDIMSSSSVLAERDLKEWKQFYDNLKLSVSCNTNKQSNDLKKCYESQIVYGTVEQFAGDWLRHHFERMGVLGQRKFECAIVDEVDSLMLDKGQHTVYLSCDMPALQHLNPLLACIWATANQYTTIGSETTVGKKYPFHQVILENITPVKDTDEFTILQLAEDAGILPKGSVTNLRKNPSLFAQKTATITAKQLAEFFKTVERRFLSTQFALYRTNEGVIKELNKTPQKGNEERKKVRLLLNDGGFCQYIYSDIESVLRAAEAEITSALHFTPCEVKQGENNCYVPGFLKDLVNSKLKVWIRNAFHAQTMTVDHEYVLEGHGVVPVDYRCTGVVENYMKWSNGLHQFLEMKHQYKLSDMTAITNYMSNVGLLQKYGDQIYGITGTLGQRAETETLQKIYDGVTTCQIPTFKRRKLFEVEGVIVDDENEWLEKICSVVAAQINPTQYRTERAVLVICETIGRAKAVNDALGQEVNKSLYINNNKDNSAIFASRLEAGQVIIATNLAGRGTDLGVSDQVKNAGGLFVVQTFLPNNARVEAQAFGRTARQGSPGSAQLIVCSNHLCAPLQLMVWTKELLSSLKEMVSLTPLYQELFEIQFKLYQSGHVDSRDISETLSHILTKTSDSGIKLAKTVRDDCVAEELATYSRCHIPMMKKKAELFSQYLDSLEDLYKSNNNKPAESHVSALNGFWGMWLLTNFNENDSTLVLKAKLAADVKTARRKLEQRESPLSNLHHYTVFGNELRKNGRHEESIEMYTKAIQGDRCWAAVAYYNRAFACLAKHDRQQDQSCLEQALEDLQNALKSVELYCDQIYVTHRYSRQTVEDVLSGRETRFDGHLSVRYKVLQFFKDNIKEAIKKVDRAVDFGGKVKVDESLVYFLAPLVHFLPLMFLSTQSLIHSRDLLKMHQLINHPSFDIVSELRCLESLGLTHVYTLDTVFTLGGFFSKIVKKIIE